MPRAQRASQAWISVVTKGPLWDKKISPVVKRAMIDECLKKIQERFDRRPPKRLLGMQRNPVRTKVTTAMALGEAVALEFGHVESKFHNPRKTGSSWVRKNVAIARGMAPRVLRKAAQRIVAELS